VAVCGSVTGTPDVSAVAATATVTAAVPVTPSTVAVIVALPTATAVTTPLPLTVATAAFDELHVTARPVSGFPLASRALAVSCCVPPTVRLAVAGDTLTVATGTGRTVTETVADSVAAVVPGPEPVQVAVTVAVPGATAITTPLPDADTTAGFEEANVYATVTPVLARVTDGSAVWPGNNSIAGAGQRHSVIAGGANTVTLAVPVTPCARAVITAVPGPTAVTTPALLTVATATFELNHSTDTVPAPGSRSTTANRVAAEPADRATFTGATCTLRTPTTSSDALPCAPPALAVIDTDPRPTPVTTPLPDTDATAALELLHPDTPAGSVVPRARTVADSCTCPPTGTVEDDTATTTWSGTAGVMDSPPEHPEKTPPPTSSNAAVVPRRT
jgi:hypothetical protein